MKKRIQKIVLYLFAVGFGVLFLLFLSGSLIIGNSVQEQCRDAQERYDGDCVEALIQLLDDEDNSYADRNHVIWALGQLGDERALPMLEKYYTGEIPEREPYDAGISQYELKKAVNLASGGFNITSFIWRSKL
ncbi:MAG: HEAT repeat domain-containing protein [Candidatus Kerfeldbacteria bacterium]